MPRLPGRDSRDLDRVEELYSSVLDACGMDVKDTDPLEALTELLVSEILNTGKLPA